MNVFKVPPGLYVIAAGILIGFCVFVLHASPAAPPTESFSDGLRAALEQAFETSKPESAFFEQVLASAFGSAKTTDEQYDHYARWMLEGRNLPQKRQRSPR